MGAFRTHERVFVHDGMVAVGAVSTGGAMEVFLDEHKLIYFYAPDMSGPEEVLARLAIPARPALRHFSELGHVHVSLAGAGEGVSYREVADRLLRELGLELEETREYI